MRIGVCPVPIGTGHTPIRSKSHSVSQHPTDTQTSGRVSTTGRFNSPMNLRDPVLMNERKL